MNILIVKLGATGDVVRTTTLLRRLPGSVTWITAAKNAALFKGLPHDIRCFSWEQREKARGTHYELTINLEDTFDVAQFLKSVKSRQLFGAYANSDNALRYTDNARGWFDLSLISSRGRQEADHLKFLNRRTYQELIFEGLGFRFSSEKYLLAGATETGLSGDVAIAADSGSVWPMKKWAYYDELKRLLETQGLRVNVLRQRPTLLEHMGDVRNHRCLVGGDSLPMHFALGTGTRCVTLFTCTSPWEIHDYGIQQKIVSPLLEEYFYKREFDRRATTAISLHDVFNAVMGHLKVPAAKA